MGQDSIRGSSFWGQIWFHDY